MCGISGIVGLRKPIAVSHIRAMNQALAHRGPDDEGYLLSIGNELLIAGGDRTPSQVRESQFLYSPQKHVLGITSECSFALAHSRLSILDLSALGHQPMTRDGRFWIVFNGEIYNYIELRAELELKGFSFSTQTDTEVLLAAYEAWGEDCLARLNGMWAFVIFDKERNIFFGARDRFGVKPFYYWSTQDHFSFASEIKSLLQLPFIERRVNREAVFDYCFLGWGETTAEGFFKGVRELEPAHSFVFHLSDASFFIKRYYSLPYNDSLGIFDQGSAAEYVDGTRQRLQRSISRRLRSDVPVGSCLSGGIDSSAIVCIVNQMLGSPAARAVGQQQNVFTACYGVKPFDEKEWAAKVVKQTGASWYITNPNGRELSDDLEDLVYSQDIPVISATMYAQYRIMKLASQSGVKVLLDGQGGDELFSGYVSFYRTYFIEMAQQLRMGMFISELAHLKNSPAKATFLLSSTLFLTFIKTLNNPLRSCFLRSICGESRYINRDFWEENTARFKLFDRIFSFRLNKTLAQYMGGHELKSLLRYEDRNSMRFSIEARLPFVDDIELAEYVFGLPASYKIHQGWSKYLLREAVKGLVPDQIRLRKDKTFFLVPELRWLMSIPDAFRNYCTPELSKFLNIDLLKKDWPQQRYAQNNLNLTFMWRVLNLAVWMKVFKVSL